MRILLTVPIVFLFALCACKKPVMEVSLDYVPPLILSTSIYDSLPAKAVNTLQLEHVNGVKIKHYDGSYTNYFEYDADKNLLLQTISSLPIPINAEIADVSCQRISFQEIDMMRKGLRVEEFESTASFWNAAGTDVEIYQCLKPPYRHIIRVSKNSNRILHRVEFTG